jgi:hypothetical protein
MHDRSTVPSPRPRPTEEERRRLLSQVYRMLLTWCAEADTTNESAAEEPDSLAASDTPTERPDVQEGV